MDKRLIIQTLIVAISVATAISCGRPEPTPAPPSEIPESEPAATELPPPDPEAEARQVAEVRQRLSEAAAIVEQDDEPPSPDPATLSAEDVPATLARAAAAEQAGQLDAGEDNALSLYLSVLEIEADQAEALAGAARVVAAVIARGERALAEGNYPEAVRLAQRLQRSRPDDPAVGAFAQRVAEGRELALLLGEARRLAAAGHHAGSDGENAATLFREALRMDPDNAAALQGLEDSERALLELAIAAAEAGRYAESDRLLAEASRTWPGSETVQNASTRIVGMRQSRADELAAETLTAIAEGRYDEATRLVDRLEQVWAQAEGIEDLRLRIESARTYANFRPGEIFSDTLRGGDTGPEMVVIPVGSFQMGSPESEPGRRGNEGPRHRVTIGRAFALGRTEVTVGQFRKFVQASGHQPTATRARASTIYDERSGSMVDKRGVGWEHDHAGNRADDDLPVAHVSWDDAHAYAAWLAKQTGRPYRLSSEAEFEYALRAGSATRFPWGDGTPARLVGNLTGDGDRSALRRSWVNSFPDYSDGYWGSAPVGKFEPNAFGLHDMVGNVSEWVEDCWHENYQRAPTDGSAWVNPGCSRRVIRGSSWASAPDVTRSAHRLPAAPDTTNARLGFRVARTLR